VSIEQSAVPNTCGCCQPDGSPTPQFIVNRPGLAAIQYRVGTYASFLLAMMEGIAHAPELRQTWLTRSTDDFGIDLLAMWAYVADILTFYQERIANEAYLRTALLQDSVNKLAALLDYKPAPGSAAEAELAFFIEAGKQVQIPIGLRVQSVPGQNEKPQKFETVEAVTAYGLLNQLQIFPHPQTYLPFVLGSAQAVLLSDTKGLAPAIKLAIFNPDRTERKTIASLSLHNTQQILAWTPPVQSADFSALETQAVVYDKEYHLFGGNTPSSYVQSVPDPAAPGGVRLQLVTAPYSNSNLPPPPSNRFALDARFDDLKPGMSILIAQEGSSANPTDSFARLATVTNVTSEVAINGPLQSTVTWLTTGMAVDSTPVVALDSGGKLNVFCIGDDGALWTIRQITSGWSGWQSLGGKIDRLVVGRNADSRLEVFARGANNALWHIRQTSPGGGWSPWDSLGGQIDLLAVGSNQDGRLEVFATSAQDQSLWHIWQVAPNNSWSGWSPLGGTINLLAVTNDKDGRLEVFARGADLALWHIWQVAPNNGWSGWSSLGGIIDLLAVGKNQDGRIEVFARGTDRALWHIWQTAPNNGWSGWASLGGIIDLLAVGTNQDGRLEVFARGTDLALWHIWQVAPNNGWSSWSSLGGVIDLLAVGRNQDGRLEPLVRGTDQALWHIWQVAPNNGWSGWSSLGLPMWTWTVETSGRVTIYSVVRSLDFSPFEYGDTISGGKVYVPVSVVSGLETKRSIIFDDVATNPETVQVTEVQQIDTNGDGEPDHWEISFTPDLSRTLDTSTATLYGNVANSTHGQTISGEVLGDGDSSQTFQSFQLQKSPVTFVHKAGAPHGVADTLQIQIGGVYWNEVQNLFGRGPKERVFITTEDASGMSVQFGDGVTGSRVPTGRGNVVATYRQGIGLAGNVTAGALRTLLDRPVGLKSVSNPASASGGSEPESLDQSRTNAPNTVRTFGRIVSLQDFEYSAREFAGVAKAHSSWEWNGEEKVVYVTVSGPSGAAIVGTTYDELVADLNSRRDPNRALQVRAYAPIPIKLQATIFVSPDYVADDVLAAVQSAVNNYFSFDNLQFGQPIHLSNVYSTLQNVAGIVGADLAMLQFKNASDAATHGATADAVQVHLRINDDELATLQDPNTDAIITVGQVQS
jgi:Baseplate J-like protein